MRSNLPTLISNHSQAAFPNRSWVGMVLATLNTSNEEELKMKTLAALMLTAELTTFLLNKKK